MKKYLSQDRNQSPRSPEKTTRKDNHGRPADSTFLLEDENQDVLDVQNKANHKEQAGDDRKWKWTKSSFSIKYNTRKLSASFKKSDEAEYEIDLDPGVSSVSLKPVNDDKLTKENALSSESPAKTENENNDQSHSGVSSKTAHSQGQEGSMENLKYTGMKVADLSSKTHWIKDQVTSFWSKSKGRAEEEYGEECDHKDMKTVEDTIYQGHACCRHVIPGPEDQPDNENNLTTSLGDCKEKQIAVEDKASATQELELESECEPDKTKKKTDWIRDQVSNFISKTKHYSSTSSKIYINDEQDEGKSGKDLKSNTEINSKDSKQQISMNSLKSNATEGEATEDVLNVDPLTHPKEGNNSKTSFLKVLGSTKQDKDESEREKFSEMHQDISKNIVQHTGVSSDKEPEREHTPPSDETSKVSPVKLSSTKKPETKKSRLKGFLSSHKPSTQDQMSKEGQDRVSPKPGHKTFKFSTKLTFSELLHSQDHASSSPEDELKTNANGGGTSVSPVPRKDEETQSSDDDSDAIDTHNNQAASYESYGESGSSVTFVRLWSLSVIGYGLLILPPSPFVNGLIYGAVVMYLTGCLLIWLFCPSTKSIEQYKQELQEYLAEQEKGTSPKKKATRIINPASLQKPRDLKGWVHFSKEYEPMNFHLDSTTDVFTVLKEKKLHILFCKPQPEVKRETPKHLKKVRKGLRRRKKRLQYVDREEPAFLFEKEYRIDLTKADISLEPLDLPMRRIWNRKYPICLTIPPDVVHSRNISITLEDLTLESDSFFQSADDLEWSLSSDEEVFYLFPNTAREKENWYYRMQLCINPLRHQLSFQDIERGNIPRRPSDSYPHYMVELINESERITQRGVQGKRIEPHTAWLNVFFGRAFWDVWQDAYWIGKVRQKIQHRLSKLNTPPLIKEIYVKDLHLGHTLPIIHKGSLPELDEYGVWSDLQVTYKGEFTLTLETQLNVDYYVQLLTSIAKQQQTSSQSTHVQDTPDGVRMKVLPESKADEPSTSSPILTPSGAEEEPDIILQEQLPEIYLEAIDNVEEDEEDFVPDLEEDPLLSDPRTKAFLESKAGKKVAGVVGWLARSKIAKRVAETDFAKKAYEKAYEKFRKMPLTLTVTVQSLKGTLAVNLPPPPSNRLWFGFRGNPAVFLSAHPRLGEKTVRLAYLTDWIEKKLKDEFKKVFVLPSMQDISIRLMNSRLENLYPDRPLK